MQRRIAAATIIITATIAAAWLTGIVPWLTTFPSGYLQWLTPLPLTVFIPYYMTANEWSALVPVTAAAVLFSIPVLMGRTKVPVWTTFLALGLMALAWYYFALGISYGRDYQGDTYVAACGVIQLLFTLTLCALWLANRRRHAGGAGGIGGFLLVVIWHLLVSVWLATYAFPYYGELP